MYCPRCGNQPASDRVRFCPSCGFRMDGVADLLMRDGVPTNPLPPPQTNEPSQRRKGIRRGAKMIFFSLALLVPVGALSIAADEPGLLFLPLTLFLAGIFWMLYYRLFGDEAAPAPKPSQPAQFGPPPQHAYFPSRQSAPAYSPPVEKPQEHSVVDNTTRSLGQR